MSEVFDIEHKNVIMSGMQITSQTQDFVDLSYLPVLYEDLSSSMGNLLTYVNIDILSGF